MNKGEKVDDFTRKNIDTDQFRGVGNVHFFTKESINILFKSNNFEIIMLEHIEKKLLVGNNSYENSCTYNIVAKLKK